MKEEELESLTEIAGPRELGNLTLAAEGRTRTMGMGVVGAELPGT